MFPTIYTAWHTEFGVERGYQDKTLDWLMHRGTTALGHIGGIMMAVLTRAGRSRHDARKEGADGFPWTDFAYLGRVEGILPTYYLFMFWRGCRSDTKHYIDSAHGAKPAQHT